jgi:hypothetical protein
MATLVAACSDDPGVDDTPDATSYDARVGPDAAPLACPRDGVAGQGRHRLFVQGHNGTPDADGVYPLLHERILGDEPEDAVHCDDAFFVDDASGDGVWQPGEAPKALGPSDLVHGEHFLVGPGAYAEFSTVLCDDITGDITFYIPNFDVAGSEALHQLFVVHDGEEFLIAQATDDEAGNSGYNPFIRQLTGNDPDAVAGDTLLLRSTNLNGYQFSVMVWYPPSQYESWILVTVP